MYSPDPTSLATTEDVSRGLEAARRYARQIAKPILGLAPVRLGPQLEDDEGPAVGSFSDLRRAQAVAVERELARSAPDLVAFVALRYEARLIDLGAIPALSERAADAIDRIAERDVPREQPLLDRPKRGRRGVGRETGASLPGISIGSASASLCSRVTRRAPST